MLKKYEFTNNIKTYKGKTLCQIRAVRGFNNVKKGDLGGFVESEYNLSPYGNCWIYGDSIIAGKSRICGDSCIANHSVIIGSVEIYDNVEIHQSKIIGDNIVIYGEVVINEAFIEDNVTIQDGSQIGGVIIKKNATIGRDALISDRSDYEIFKPLIKGHPPITKYYKYNDRYGYASKEFEASDLDDFEDIVQGWLTGDELKAYEAFITLEKMYT